jgi:hypothetical protein
MRRKDDDDVTRVVVRERPREDTFKVVVAVVVVLLLLNFGIIVYFVHPAFNPPDDGGTITEPEPEGDWLQPTEPRILTEDESWVGEDITLTGPISIGDGVDLLIQNSHVRIYLEDLIFWLQPAFSVEQGGYLTVIDSTIEVYEDPRLKVSAFGPFLRPGERIPYIARVVNLDNATDPVLHMDIQCLGDGTELVLGVLPFGGEDIEILYGFGPADANPRSWSHVEVDLSAYVGTRPWVVIWFNSYPDYPVLVGNLSVMDDEEWPEGDAFPTGDPFEDGWAVSQFKPIHNLQRWFYPDKQGLGAIWRPLIDAEGDVFVTGSRIEEPSGLGRRTGLDIYKEAFHSMMQFPLDKVGSRGGGIEVNGSIMAMEGSSLVNVPLTGREATVEVSDSQMEGDHDLVTLHNTSASFSECTFTTNPDVTDPVMNGLTGRYLWAIGAEGVSPDGPIEILDSMFIGTPMGVELTRAESRIEGNTFTHIPGMAIWDHEPVGGVEWDTLRTSNTFEDAQRYFYLRTSVTEVEFTHPEGNASKVRIYSGGPTLYGVELENPFTRNLKFKWLDRASYILPETLVLRTGEVQHSPGIHAQLEWENAFEDLYIPPGTEAMKVDLQDLFNVTLPKDELAAPMDLWGFEPGNGTDVYELLVTITDLSGMRVIDPIMRFQVDGRTVDEINLTEDLVVEDGYIFVWQNLTLQPGWRDIQVSVWGREWIGGDDYTEDPVEVDTFPIPILMMATDVEVEPWMSFAAYMVVVPEGVSASIDEMVPEDSTGHYFDILFKGWSGSSLKLDCSGLPPETSAHFHVPSNLSIEVVNATVRQLEVNDLGHLPWEDIEPGTITIQDVVTDDLEMNPMGRNVTMSDITVRDQMSIYSFADPNILIENSILQEAAGTIEMVDGDLDMRNCSISSNWSRGLNIYPTMANITIMNCTFANSYVMLLFSNVYWEAPDNLEITGCHFNEDWALLYIGWDIINVDTYDVDADYIPTINGSIDGNSFTAKDGHVVLHFGLFDQLWGNNVLDDGIHLHAFYITRLQVIPPESSPFWRAYTFLPREGVITDWPFDIPRSFLELDGEIMIEVSDDPSVALDPPVLEVFLHSITLQMRIVRGFDQVVPNADNDEATYPVYPEFPDILIETLIYWPPLDTRD